MNREFKNDSLPKLDLRQEITEEDPEVYSKIKNKKG